MVKFVVRVKPGSFKEGISIGESGDWVIKIKAKPIDGEANNYLIQYLSKEFEVNKSSIIIEKGATNHYKTLIVNIDDITFNAIKNKYKTVE